MIALLPLALCWLCAPIFLLLDGRKTVVAGLAAAVLVAVAAVDMVLLIGMVWQGHAPLATVTGGWPSGPGIRLHVDRASLFFAVVCASVLAMVMIHETLGRVRSASFPALILFTGAGLHGAFFTGDLFNFYVFFEVSVVSSFALAAYGYGRAEVRGAFVYIVANLLGSGLFLTGIALVYHTTGALDLVAIASRSSNGVEGVHPLAAALLFAALSLKLGLFPLHGWVPVLYSHAQPAVAAVMSGALINIGTYGLLRIGLLAADYVRAGAEPLLLGLGAFTLVYGALLAARRKTSAEIIAYASIAQAGYVIVALGVGGQAGTVAALFVVLAGSIEKAAMFLSQESWGRPRAFAALAAAAGVAGLPLTLGLLAKIQLLRAAVHAPFAPGLIAAIVVATGFLFVAVVHFWDRVRRMPKPDKPNPLASAILASATVALTLFAAPLDWMAAAVSDDLLTGGGR